jgi:hypothetical protein
LAKLHAARCPSCGANIQVPPHAHSIQCRYCSNVITVQHQKAPQMQMPGIPSTTLYIDPEEIARAGRSIARFVMLIVGLTVVLPIVIGLVAWGGSRMKSKMKPFPVECAYGETVELSGDWTGTGPVIAKAEHGCKIHIKQSKLKAPSLMKANVSNVEITLENVTVETTEAVVQGESNLKLHLVGTTLVSSGDVAVKAGANTELDASASKITGKKAALDLGPNAKIALKNGTDLVATDGVALKTTSSLVLDLEGGKLDGSESALVATSGAKITGKNVIFTAKAGETMHLTSSTTLDLTDGAITSSADSAIQSDGGELTLAGTKVQGVPNAINGGNGLKLKATKKAAFVATAGDGIEVTSNGNLVFVDATVDGTRTAIKSTLNLKLKPSQGARLTGKNGGVATGHNFELDANGATIDGGSGPGLLFDANGKIQMQQGGLKGNPAFKTTYKPITLALDGTKVEGEQQIQRR